MSLQTAILALTPALYWRLNEAPSSTTVADSAGGGFPGTVSGDVGLGAFGPELDRTSARIFSTGLITSPNWGSTVWSNFSVLIMTTVPANGFPSAGTVFAGLGDSSNPGLRGFRMFQTSAASNNLSLSAGFNIGTSNAPTAAPLQTWHLFGFTFQASPSQWRAWWDGSPATTQTANPTLPPIATDKWYIQSTAPIVVSDFAVFTRVLTQTEIQTVSTQVQAWPYQVPINTPIPVQIEGGALTEEQAAQLARIDTTTQTTATETVQIPYLVEHTNTIEGTTTTTLPIVSNIQSIVQGMVTDTFPTLAEVLGKIQTSVIATIEAPGGAIQTTLGELFRIVTNVFADELELTDGPTCEHVDQLVIGPFSAVRILITSRPEDLTYYAPDRDFVRPDYCTVSIWTGNKHVARWGVHQEAWLSPGFPATQPFTFAFMTLNITQPNTHVIVDWMPGVCGQVWLEKAEPGGVGGLP